MPAATETNAVSSDDRRSETRTTTIYRPVLITVGGITRLCLLRNISPTGFLGMVYENLPANEPIEVEFYSGSSVSGIIRWSEDRRIGVEFDQEIDVLSTLQDLGKRMLAGRINRAPRLQLECPVEIRAGNERITTTMFDVSQRGIKIANSKLRYGEEVIVQIERMEQRKAVVRWQRNGMAGLNFVRPLRFDELAEWSASCGADCQASLDAKPPGNSSTARG